MMLLRMVEVRDLRDGDVLATSSDRRLVVGSTEQQFTDDPYWWAGSTFYIRATYIDDDNHTRSVDVEVKDGDENTKVGVWR